MSLHSALSSIEKPANSQYAFKPYQKYKVFSIEEGFWGVLFLQGSSINLAKFEGTLNKYASQGWYIAGFFTEKKRKFLFWSVERAIIIMAVDQQRASTAA